MSNDYVARHSRMFSGLADFYRMVRGESDPMGGETESTPLLVAEDVPVYVEDLNAADVAAMQAGGVVVTTSVFTPEDPGDLEEGSQVVVKRRSLRLARSETLRVVRVSSSEAGSFTLWRIDCKSQS